MLAYAFLRRTGFAWQLLLAPEEELGVCVLPEGCASFVQNMMFAFVLGSFGIQD